MRTVEFTDEQFRILYAYLSGTCGAKRECHVCPLCTSEDHSCVINALETVMEADES